MRNGVGSRSKAPGNHRFSVGMIRVVSIPFRWDPLFLPSPSAAAALLACVLSIRACAEPLTTPHPAPPFPPRAQQRRSATARRSAPRRRSGGAGDGRLRPLLPHADTQSGPSSFSTVYVYGRLCSVVSFLVCSVQLQCFFMGEALFLCDGTMDEMQCPVPSEPPLFFYRKDPRPSFFAAH
jgi:hypothetical protein